MPYASYQSSGLLSKQTHMPGHIHIQSSFFSFQFPVPYLYIQFKANVLSLHNAFIFGIVRLITTITQFNGFAHLRFQPYM